MVILLVCACLVWPDVCVHDERVLTCLILQSSDKREEVLQVWAATPQSFSINQSAKWTVSPMQEVVLRVTIKYEIVIFAYNIYHSKQPS